MTTLCFPFKTHTSVFCIFTQVYLCHIKKCPCYKINMFQKVMYICHVYLEMNSSSTRSIVQSSPQIYRLVFVDCSYHTFLLMAIQQIDSVIQCLSDSLAFPAQISLNFVHYFLWPSILTRLRRYELWLLFLGYPR